MQTIDKKQLSRDWKSFRRKAPHNGHSLFREDPSSGNARLRRSKTNKRHHSGSSEVAWPPRNTFSLQAHRPSGKRNFSFSTVSQQEEVLPVKIRSYSPRR